MGEDVVARCGRGQIGAIMGMYSQVALRVWNKRLPSTELGFNRSKGYEVGATLDTRRRDLLKAINAGARLKTVF